MEHAHLSRRIDDEIALIPWYPAADITLAWYQDAATVKQSDNRDTPYTPEDLERMYSFLNTHGECCYIEYRGEPAGDITLRDNGEICIVIAKQYRNRHIGRRCVPAVIARAREKGYGAVRANIYTFNQQSRRMFLAAGFVQTDEEWFEYRLRKEPQGVKNMKPVIGITPLWDEEKQSYWMLPGYMDGIREAGGIPVMLPMTDDPEELAKLVSLFDAFLFTGGQDVTPSVYGEAASPLTCPCPMRDAMEVPLLKLVLQAEKPVLGICRGIQLINAALGGTLYQDIPSEHPSAVNHHQGQPYDAPVHTVRLTGGSPLRQALGTEELPVNSLHHQAVKLTAPGLEAMAVSPDGLTEAVYMPHYPFLWAVQWHPEFSHRRDEAARRIFQAFVKAAE